MMNRFAVQKQHYSEKYTNLPHIDSLLKISLGLILFTMISFTLVYAETISVDVKGTSFDIEYTTFGMSISDIESDTDFNSLILIVDVIEPTGMLDITLNRSFLDSTYNGLDDEFLILADADVLNFSETTTTAQSRTLHIELPAGTEEIEIVGSAFGVSAPIAIPAPGSDVVVDPVTPEPDPVTPEPDPVTPEPDPVIPVDPVDPVDKTPADDTPSTQCGPGNCS